MFEIGYYLNIIAIFYVLMFNVNLIEKRTLYGFLIIFPFTLFAYVLFKEYTRLEAKKEKKDDSKSI